MAARVFLDTNRIEFFDGREAYGEDRWKTVGQVAQGLLSVIFTLRGTQNDRVRLISARKADSHERTHYREIHT